MTVMADPEYVVHGQWKDSCVDCGQPGGCSSFWMAVWWPCCGPCLISKIMSRMRVPLNQPCLGRTIHAQWLNLLTFLVFLWWGFFFLFSTYQSLFEEEVYADWNQHQNHGGHSNIQFHITPKGQRYLDKAGFYDHLMWMISMFFTCVVVLLRTIVRRRYLIPSNCDEGRGPGQDGCCGAMEDVFMGVMCQPCALSQMARHTNAVPNGCDPCVDPGPVEAMAPVAVQRFVANMPPQPPNGMWQPQGVHPQNPNYRPQQAPNVEVGRVVQPAAPALNP